MNSIIFKYNPKKNKAVLDASILEEVREKFSVKNPDKEIQEKRGGYAPDRHYMIDKFGNFDVGMFSIIYKFCKKEFSDYTVKISEELNKVCFPKLNINISETDFKARNYQLDSINQAFKYGRGILKVGTGGGKTIILANMLESCYQHHVDFSAVVLVPTLQLVNQTYNDFKKSNASFTFTRWTGTIDCNEGCNVIITNVSNFLAKHDPKFNKYEVSIHKQLHDKTKDQIKKIYEKLKPENRLYKNLDNLYKAKKKKFVYEEEKYTCLTTVVDKMDKAFKHINFVDNLLLFSDYLFVDECHGINYTAKTAKVVDKFVTNNRFGFTGTTPKDKLDYWKGVGIIGPVIYVKKSKSLRDENFLSDADIQILKINHKDFPDYERNKPPTHNYNIELDFCFKSLYRNKIIIRLLKKLNKNSLLIVERIEQGEILYKLAKNISNKRVYYITGEMPVEERDRIKQEMETRDDIVCIAISKIFSVGISINNIHYLFFVSIGKSFIKVIQSIGRGLRKHDSKQKLIIFDISDNLIYSCKHLQERIGYYEEEEFNFKIKDFYE